MMNKNVKRIVLVVLLAVACALTAYYFFGNKHSQSRKQTESDFSVTILNVGGLCLQGLCKSETVIKGDGSFVYTYDSERKSGQIPQSEVVELRNLIFQTDFVQIKSKPFTDTCPMAYDGSKFIYTFVTSKISETIDTCEVQTKGNPLFIKLLDIQKTYIWK